MIASCILAACPLAGNHEGEFIEIPEAEYDVVALL